ncbi:hypothetical protein L226DRAFT_575923 [Lentinus tigrinus ALCF2SS1-7]|uniref:Uncharacterized protein n=1 Tax=Lentinus tigrinus ALCF2SS1-6 TaxID=1328759 RepID=A0A5C2S4L3_9APHY|nr:hypothetical protein L227DRAFT_613268 [Lentinus tigrinus ALCF2SS1-6]RPD68990.1 hypothetical protein L226DRAFT_575923 [Lentinus tigrinus ALCF2SS1-7]
MTEMGFFGDPSGNIEFQPLVHLWLDIEAHLKQEDIVSPVHFYEEIDAITQIIRDARARTPSLPPLREPLPCGLEDEDDEMDDARHHEEDTGGEFSDRASSSKRGRLRPRKLLRKLCAKLQWAFRLPSVLWGLRSRL